MTTSVAILIDGDNIAPTFWPHIQKKAASLGRAQIARAYLNTEKPSPWTSTPGLLPVHAGAGKNAADILLCIDAMEFCLTRGIDTFVIASSDRDFTHLATRLRETGRNVVGMGEAKAPPAFRAACTAFQVLTPKPKQPAKTETPKKLNFEQVVQTVIKQHDKDGRGLEVTALNPIMRKLHDTRISARPEKTWRAYLNAHPDLFDLDPKGPDARVRCRPVSRSPTPCKALSTGM